MSAKPLNAQYNNHEKLNADSLHNVFNEHIGREDVVDDDIERAFDPPIQDKEKNDPYLVQFKPGDRENPRNFSKARKWFITAFTAFLCFSVAVGSSMPTGNLEGAAEDLHVSSEAINLSITLFVAGFGFGPMVFAPLSEVFGRWIIYVVSGFLYFIFNLPCALAPNLATLLAGRMIAGLAASVPMTNVGGTLSDIWTPEEKGISMAVFSSVLFIGPAAGPLVGGAITSGTNELRGWRYIYWTLFAFIGLVWICTFFTHETLAIRILQRRAQKLRKETGDNRYQTEHERNPVQLKKVITISLLRPFEMLLKEPILIFFSLYLCLVYALLYLMFFAYPIVFAEGHGFNPLQTGLCFLSIVIGICFAMAFILFIMEPASRRRVARRGYSVPEDRLPLMFCGSVLLPVSLFILAWTSMPSVHWAGCLVGGIPTGASFTLIYVSANSYIVDCYIKHAASALAAKTLLRSLCGAAVPLFVNQMFHAMHNQWAFTLLALVSVLMGPIPFFFYKYGPSMRAKSQFATGDDD